MATMGMTDLNTELENLVATLDLPDVLYEEAVSRYEDVAEWLCREGSPLREYSPSIYPQGSFRLGTVIPPLGHEHEFDIDLVCRLAIAKERTTQADLKTDVGARLRSSAELAKVLEERRRCWRLSYPRELHLDVLPAIPDANGAQDGILLTDKDLRLWQHSNPIAYAGWFFERMRQVLAEEREILAKSANVSVEEVPEWRVRTPLQRAVQLLKRHRDVYFKGDDDRRPVSIIITTLAAWAYQQQRDLEGTLVTLAREMPRYIEQRRGQWWVANPVTPEENFADKWNEKPERRTAFLRWLSKLEEDLGLDRVTKSADARREMLAESFGVQRRGMGWMVKSAMVPTLRSEDVPALADWSHSEQSRWPVHRSYSCRVRARVYRARGRTRPLWPLADRPVPKDYALRFEADTNAPRPYEIHWQVVNTGREAALDRGLRGAFYESNGGAGVRWETTKYAGTHWVEAFVIKNGLCVARSGHKDVRIKA